jgi:chromosome partitioning protein
MRSIAWLSEKGGTGKTTSAINTAVGLAKLGHKVLLIDADPQANATMVLLGGEEAEPPTLTEVLTNKADAGDTIRKTATPRLELLPAVPLLADTNVFLASEPGRERRLRLALRGVDEAYDFVVIDTSPQRTLINMNVLNYVAEVYCPVDPGIFSLAGLAKLQEAVALVVRYLDNAALRIVGLVLTRTRRDNISRDVEAQLRATFGALVCETAVPDNTKIGEAHARFMSVLDYAPRSLGATAYEALTREIIAHGQRTQDGLGSGPVGVVSEDRHADRGPRRSARAAG